MDASRQGFCGIIYHSKHQPSRKVGTLSEQPATLPTSVDPLSLYFIPELKHIQEFNKPLLLRGI